MTSLRCCDNYDVTMYNTNHFYLALPFFPDMFVNGVVVDAHWKVCGSCNDVCFR